MAAACPPDWPARYAQLTGKDRTLCPQCGQGHLVRWQTVLPLRHCHSRVPPGVDSSRGRASPPRHRRLLGCSLGGGALVCRRPAIRGSPPSSHPLPASFRVSLAGWTSLHALSELPPSRRGIPDPPPHRILRTPPAHALGFKPHRCSAVSSNGFLARCSPPSAFPPSTTPVAARPRKESYSIGRPEAALSGRELGEVLDGGLRPPITSLKLASLAALWTPLRFAPWSRRRPASGAPPASRGAA